MLIIVVLNSFTNNPNIFAISDSGSDVYIGSSNFFLFSMFCHFFLDRHDTLSKMNCK